MSQFPLYAIIKITNLLMWLRKSLHPSSATDFNLYPFHAAPIKFLPLSNQNFLFFFTKFQIFLLLTHLLHSSQRQMAESGQHFHILNVDKPSLSPFCMPIFVYNFACIHMISIAVH